MSVMKSRPEVAERVLNETSGLCSRCKEGLPATLVEREGKIYMKKVCPEHGPEEVLIASDAGWYHDVMSYPAALKAPRNPKNRVELGCPFDCGACDSHEQQVYLPVIPITSSCNLDCPICYTINNNKGPYHISLDDFSTLLKGIKQNDPDMKIINLTGGEPTLHPQIRDIIRLCHESGIHRVTISTHGLTFIKDEALLEELARLNARIVLSFNSFNENVNSQMIGVDLFAKKLRVLEQLEKYNIDTTLIPVLAEGMNTGEIGKLIELMLGKEFIRSLEIHTMTFTGQSGTTFNPGSRLTTPDVLRYMEEQTGGMIKTSDFVPSPCAHPLCYQTSYLLKTGENEYLPFARFMSRKTIRDLMTDNLYIEPGEKLERALQDVIYELWSMELPDETAGKVLASIKNILKELFPRTPLPYHERQIISERTAKTIYIHSHMDEASFDTDRIRQCCVGVPEVDGGNTPTCSYNILYRGRDERFTKAKLKPLSEFGGGRKF